MLPLSLALLVGCAPTPSPLPAQPAPVEVREVTAPGSATNTCVDELYDENAGQNSGWDIATVEISRTEAQFSYTFTSSRVAVGAGESMPNTEATLTIGDPSRNQPFLPLTTFFAGDGSYRVTAWSDTRGEFRVNGEVTGTTDAFTTTIPASVLDDAGVGTTFEWYGHVFFDMTIGDGCPGATREQETWVSSAF